MSNYDDEAWQDLKDYYADDDNWTDADIDDEDYIDAYQDDVYSWGFQDGYRQAMYDMKWNNVITRLIRKLNDWWYIKRHPMDDIPF
jgi:hypothetical protein